MVFGEIVEPSTRALFGDDYTEYPEIVESQLEWEDNSEVPDVINTLLVIENVPIINFFRKCIISNKEPIKKLKNVQLEVFKLEDEKYIVISKLSENIACGQVTEVLIPWIIKASNVFTITSSAITLHQGSKVADNKTECFIRTLNFNTENFNCKKLEVPNLITGLSADVLSYCIHIRKPSTLFVAYIDSSSLDSVNSQPLLDLAKQLKFKLIEQCKLKMNAPVNNLYM